MNASNSAPRKSTGKFRKSLGWLTEEWVLQLALVVAVVTVFVDGLISSGSGGHGII